MSEQHYWEVEYATPSDVTVVRQTNLEANPPKGFERGVVFFPLADPEDAGVEKTPWLIDEWLRAEMPTITSGRAKSLKSYFARQMALAIASGKPFLGAHKVLESAQGQTVVMVCAEEKKADVYVALRRAATGIGLSKDEFKALPIKIIPAVGRDLFRKDPRSGDISPTVDFYSVLNGCKATNPPTVLIVIDTLIALKGNTSENLSDDVRPIFTLFRKLGEEVAATVLVVDHEGHDVQGLLRTSRQTRRPRGSSDKVGAVDDAISLAKVKEEGTTFHIDAQVVHRGASSGHYQVRVIFDDPGGPIVFVGPHTPVTAAMIEAEGRELLRLIASGVIGSKRQLQEALQLKSPTSLDKLLDRYTSLVEIAPASKGMPAHIGLSDEGSTLARELGFEVLTDEGAHDDLK